MTRLYSEKLSMEDGSEVRRLGRYGEIWKKSYGLIYPFAAVASSVK